jgi:hypothetical protein
MLLWLLRIDVLLCELFLIPFFSRLENFLFWLFDFYVRLYFRRFLDQFGFVFLLGFISALSLLCVNALFLFDIVVFNGFLMNLFCAFDNFRWLFCLVLLVECLGQLLSFKHISFLILLIFLETIIFLFISFICI